MAKVYATIERPPRALVERFRATRLEVLVQMLGFECLMDPAIKPLAHRNWRICGPALTVVPDGTDTLAGVTAVELAQAGDVFVVAARGNCSAGCWGGGLTLTAQLRGCEGVVVDGAVLDSRMILERAVPVFCRTSTAAHTVGHLPGSVNVQTVCGGVQVRPGDLIIGELDGVMVIPREDLGGLIEPAEARTRKLEEAAARLADSSYSIFEMRGGRRMLEDKGVEWFD